MYGVGHVPRGNNDMNDLRLTVLENKEKKISSNFIDFSASSFLVLKCIGVMRGDAMQKNGNWCNNRRVLVQMGKWELSYF